MIWMFFIRRLAGPWLPATAGREAPPGSYAMDGDNDEARQVTVRHADSPA